MLMGDQLAVKSKTVAARLPVMPDGRLLYPVHADALQFSDHRPKLTP
jgi:hypothetical protein